MRHTNYRRIRDAEEVLLSSYEQDAEEAAFSLINYELAYGGEITDLKSTSLEVTTPISSNKIDRTVYEGSALEVLRLTNYAMNFLEMKKSIGLDALREMVFKLTGGVPIVVACAGPMIEGHIVLNECLKKES